MDVTNKVAPAVAHTREPPSAMATDSMMDVDMDIDFSMEPEGVTDLAGLQAEAEALAAARPYDGHPAELTNVSQQPERIEASDAMNGVEEQEEGEIEQYAPVAKIHVRGVENFNPMEAKAYAHEHYDTELFQKLEWVNDSSFNIVYDTEEAALEALQAYSAEDRTDPLELRPAKHYSARPDQDLSVRQAVLSDVKLKSAHLYSGFYLRNPKWDPDSPENARKRKYNDRRYRERGPRDYGYDRRPMRDMGDEMYQRRASQTEAWDENLYDDDPASRAARRESRSEEGSVAGGKRQRVEDDLVVRRDNGRLRNRSASPLRDRDGDGRYGFRDEHPRRRTARPRSPTPPRARPNARGREARDNLGAADLFRKELFPGKSATSAFTNGHADESKDIISTHSSSSDRGGPKELFPNHRRQDAHDIDHEYRDLDERLDNYSLHGDNNSHRQQQPRDKPRDLFDRIGPAPSSSGRLQDPAAERSNGRGEDGGFSFKGAGNAGFSILGASSKENSRPKESPLVKELFPLKAGGGGGQKPELFDVKIKGRGSQRRRAEDLF
jgi:hypothetical protein